MEFRSVAMSDVDALWELQAQLDNETKFMLYEAGERKKDLGPVEEAIRPVLEGRDFLEVAVDNDRLVGYLSARRGSLARTHHSVYVVTGVLKACQNQGIATTFFNHLDQWARQNGIKRMELVVMAPMRQPSMSIRKPAF